MVGTSNLSVPEMAIDVFSDIFPASSSESPMRLQSEMKSLKDAEVSCGSGVLLLVDMFPRGNSRSNWGIYTNVGPPSCKMV
jgi:hypothetical protein